MTTEQTFTVDCRMQLVTDQDDPRYAFDGVLCTAEYRVATDGRRLAITKADKVEGYHLIPGKALPKRKTKTTIKVKQTETPNEYIVGDKTTQGVEGMYPDVASGVKKLPENQIAVALNPKFLLELAQALGQDKHRESVLLVLDADDSTGPITVLGPEGFGVIMPVVRDKSTEKEIKELEEKIQDFKTNCVRVW